MLRFFIYDCVRIYIYFIKVSEGSSFSLQKKREKGVLAVLFIFKPTRNTDNIQPLLRAFGFSFFISLGNFFVSIFLNKAPLWGRPSTVVGQEKTTQILSQNCALCMVAQRDSSDYFYFSLNFLSFFYSFFYFFLFSYFLFLFFYFFSIFYLFIYYFFIIIIFF